MNPEPELVARALATLAPSWRSFMDRWGIFSVAAVLLFLLHLLASMRSRADATSAFHVRIGFGDRFFRVSALPVLGWSLQANHNVLSLFDHWRSRPENFLLIVTGSGILALLALAMTLALSGLVAIPRRYRPVSTRRAAALGDRVLVLVASLAAISDWFFVFVISVFSVAVSRPR